MSAISRDVRLERILRVGAAMCFIGHGIFGIITKAEWLPFFGLVGISPELAFTMMPLIGLVDIAMGLSVLVRPTPAALLYMAVWGLWTAALRPLSGASVFEMLERAGNYGVPFALLLAVGVPTRPRLWFARAAHVSLTPRRELLVWRALSLTTAMLLLGHGALAMQQKPVLVAHAALFGMTSDAAVLFGAVEIAMAFAVLAAPRAALLAVVALWKLGTEMLWPVAGAPIWEFVERGGSYAAPLGLGLLAFARVRTPVRSGWTGAASAAALIALLGLPTDARAQQHQQREDVVPVAPPGIFEKLRQGGYYILCRHAATDHSQQDSGPAREQQRNLSAQGESDAKAIGLAIGTLRIPIGDVRSTTVYRNRETAEYAFGRNVVDTTLFRTAVVREYFSRAVPRGTNHAVVLRQGGIYDALTEFGVTSTQEGDCFVIEPREGRFEALARLRVRHWPEAAAGR